MFTILNQPLGVTNLVAAYNIYHFSQERGRERGDNITLILRYTFGVETQETKYV